MILSNRELEISRPFMQQIAKKAHDSFSGYCPFFKSENNAKHNNITILTYLSLDQSVVRLVKKPRGG